ncbi:MAG: response regulator transcription factor [Firmicutes bacterium]|nr:response regulator transcription factor [Bacillota bacterium]
MIRVLIADDHAIVRQGLRHVLSFESDVDIIGEASNGEEAVRLAAELHPDVVMLDLTMPVVNGLEAARRIRESPAAPGIVVLTIHDDREYLLEAMRAGVTGYCLKDVDPPVLVQAIRRAHQGIAYVDPSLAGSLAFQAGVQEGLTSREMEVLAMIAQGYNNKEISEKLVISEKTCKNHVTAIFTKLNVSDRTQAALYAIRQGWVKVRPLGRQA